MKTFIRSCLRRLGYQIEGIRYTPRQMLDRSRIRSLEFDDVICRLMFERGESLTFLQIGAFDGVSTDPLYRYINRCGWRGVMIEPQPGPAKHLQRLYEGNPNIKVVEAAIDRTVGTRNLYTVESDELPRWAGGMASFDRNHILKHEYLLPGLADRIRELSVPCLPFEEILDRLPEPRLDLLQIDAEGADGFILSLFPFERMMPSVIHWEIKNLTRCEQEETLERLLDFGYRVARSGDEDMLAVTH